MRGGGLGVLGGSGLIFVFRGGGRFKKVGCWVVGQMGWGGVGVGRVKSLRGELNSAWGFLEA